MIGMKIKTTGVPTRSHEGKSGAHPSARFGWVVRNSSTAFAKIRFGGVPIRLPIPPTFAP